jgi:inorganic triphosphatase YgiF
MHNEIELKLEASPKMLRLLESKPWFRGLGNGLTRRETLVSVYFDTAKFKLRDNAVSLRVRHIGKKRLQTIKAESHGIGGPFSRKEWEVEITDDKPDLKFARDTALEPLVTNSLERKLKPVFETNLRRLTVLINSGGSQIELAIDRGTIEAGKRSVRINEIELELKSGNSDGLLKLAERLARELTLRYSARSKADRGYALIDAKPASAACADKIYLLKHSNTGDSFKLIAMLLPAT